MSYTVALVILHHFTRKDQKVKITQPIDASKTHRPQLRPHVEYILGMQGDRIDTPWEIVELTTKEL